VADVINLADRRKKDHPLPMEVITAAGTWLQEGWERAAHRNKLNEFVMEHASVWADPSAAYLSDLNALASLEEKLGISTIVRSPYGSQFGWRGSCLIAAGTASTPDMPYETYARAFCCLLFIKLKRDFAAHGMLDSL
jgi:hypothetical protein